MRELAIDAQLLVLLLAGATSRSMVEKHKRLKAFSVSDYDLLVRTIGADTRIVVTPNVLTEASNLIRQINEPDRTALSLTLRAVIEQSSEVYVESNQATRQAEYVRLGLADTGLLELCESRPLLTADAELYVAATTRGVKAENFTHLRVAAGTL